MPPHRRNHHVHDAATLPPYNGWLLCRHGRGLHCGRRSRTNGLAQLLPGDVLSVILSRASSSAADVVRYGATCRHWGHAVATYAGAISRALPPPAQFLPHLALGFFHQDAKPARGSPTQPPRFVPTEAASRHLGSHLQLPALFEHARPVASRNGRVVLELRREGRAHGALRLSVCNPMTGDVSMLPPLYGNDCPGTYGCAILTGDDLDAPARPSDFFFRVLLVYIRCGFTALRSCCSSSAGFGPRWGPEERKPGVKMSAGILRGLGYAVVVGGTAYWPMRREALGVRLNGAPSEPMDVCSVPYRPDHAYQGEHVLGASPDGKRLILFSTSFNSWMQSSFNSWIRRTAWTVFVDIETQTAAGGEWEGECHALRIKLPEFVAVTSTTAFRLRWFGERSGTVLFTVGSEGKSKGAFMLNITTGSVEKLVDGVECHACKYLCGYEMDRAALLACVAREPD